MLHEFTDEELTDLALRKLNGEIDTIYVRGCPRWNYKQFSIDLKASTLLLQKEYLDKLLEE